MKKDRNCGNNYPIYPAYPIQNMMPGIPMMPNVSPNYYAGNFNNSNISEQQLNSLSNQINSLERRISNLENLIGNNNKYNTSNYQML